MFSDMIVGLARGRMPEGAALRCRFDMALTKKMGVVRLPPAFWPADPKINPRAAHLFWAALLLRDRQRIDLALAVLAAEQAERKPAAVPERDGLARVVRDLLCQLLARINDPRQLAAFRDDLRRLVPELLPEEGDCAGTGGGGNGH